MVGLTRRILTAVLDSWYGGLAGKPISYSPDYPSANPYLAAAWRIRTMRPIRRQDVSAHREAA